LLYIREEYNDNSETGGAEAGLKEGDIIIGVRWGKKDFYA